MKQPAENSTVISGEVAEAVSKLRQVVDGDLLVTAGWCPETDVRAVEILPLPAPASGEIADK